MSIKGLGTTRGRTLVTILATLSWLIFLVFWMAFAWSQYSFFQNLVCMGIATLLFSAGTGAMWVAGQGFVTASTVLATLGWLSFTLYWIGFAWSRHSFLQNCAILVLSFCVWLGITVVLWLRPVSEEVCQPVATSREAMEFGKGEES